MEELWWFLAGAVIGYLSDLIASATFPLVWHKYKQLSFRLRTKNLRQLTVILNNPKEKLSIGKFKVDWIALSQGHYLPDRIESYYDDRAISHGPEIEKLKVDFIRDWESRFASGQTNLPYNSPTYKLKSFDIGYRRIIDSEEVPILRLSYGPTDYFTQLVTDFNVGNPIRDRIAAKTDITVEPVPEFSSILGINLNLITSDGYIIVAERNPNVQLAGGKLWASIAESLLRPTDAGPNGAPDVYRCALRAVQEELGVVLKVEDVEFTHFGVHPILCVYSLMGWSKLRETRSEVERIRALALPKDKWENSQLVYIPFNPRAIADFVSTTYERWFSLGLAAFVLSLTQAGYTQAEIHRAFSSVE